jgi:hypothetical protein
VTADQPIHESNARRLGRRRQSRDQPVNNRTTHKSGHGDPSPDRLLCGDKVKVKVKVKRISALIVFVWHRLLENLPRGSLLDR